MDSMRLRGEIKAVKKNCINGKISVTIEFTNDDNAIVDEDGIGSLADNPVFVNLESAQEDIFDDRTQGTKDENQQDAFEPEDPADYEAVEAQSEEEGAKTA